MNTNRSSFPDRLPPGAEDDSEVVRILDGYLSGIEAGEPADPDKLLADHPALADQLRAYLEVVQLAGGMARDSNARPELAGSGLLTTFNLGSDPAPNIHLIELSDEHEPLVMPHSAEMPHPAGASLGRYQLQGEIARGGMGAILRGRDVDLGRDLAIKVLLESHQGNAEVMRRFVEEAQIGGQLQHPGVVPVYELGTFPDRRPYFAMKLVKGRTLAALLAERPDRVGRGSPDPALPTTGGLPSCHNDLPRFLGIFEQVCQTMAYAHARGVIHRDLKPSNVMVGSFGEVQVMDWGLAKVLLQGGVADEAPAQPVHETVITTVRSGAAGRGSESQAGSVLGTPAYMAPEQARGEVERIDERADVFGLGAILCEILTGRPPYSGSTRGEIRAQAARGELTDALARLDASGSEIELISLAKACLEAEVERRPRNAGVVAERVTIYLTGVQERLRSAELARVDAQARAEEEMKQRVLSDELASEARARANESQVRARIEQSRGRRTVALAVSILLTAGLVAAGWAYLATQRSARLVATTRLVTDVLAEAERLRGHAQSASPGDLTMWFQAVSAAGHARDLLAQGEPDGALQKRVDATLTGVEQEQAAAETRFIDLERDRKLLADLEAIRCSRSEHWDPKQTDREYAIAFRSFGIDLDQLDPSEAGQLIARRSHSVELALYLDDWALIRRTARDKKDEASWRRLLAAAKTVDPDQWRAAVRDQIVRDDREALRRLVGDEKKMDAQPTPSLVLLALALSTRGYREPAERVLRRAWRIKPDDFWVNFELARAYCNEGESARLDEAVRYYSVAVAIRPQSFAAHGSLANALERQGKLDEALVEFRAALRVKPDDPRNHNNLGMVLAKQGKFGEALAELRAADRVKPDDPLIHDNLGSAFAAQGKLEEAIAEHREAIRLEPGLAAAHFNLANALKQQEKLEAAISEYREAIRLKAGFVWAHTNLGDALRNQRKFNEAIAEFREALRLDPNESVARTGLSLALKEQGKPKEAIAEFDEDPRLKPEDSADHNKLGAVLKSQGKLEEAIGEFREALRIMPENSLAHGNLGGALRGQGKLEESIAEYRESVRLNPNHAGLHSSFGNALADLGKLDEATAEYRAAVRLNPADPVAQYSLGNVLMTQGNLEEAISGYRAALRLKSDYAEAHCNLGHALRRQGRLVEALAEFKRGHELGSNNPNWRYPSAEWVGEAERLVELDRKLPAILAGKAKPSDVAETLGFAQLCYDKKLHGASARLWSEAFQAQPKLADDMQAQNRYNAACAAALAGTGQGKDDPPLDDAAKARWRKQALDWLKADLAAWSKILDSGPSQARQAITQTLQHWKADTDLAGIRDPAALAKLRADEQVTCRALWAEVDAVVKKAQVSASK